MLPQDKPNRLEWRHHQRGPAGSGDCDAGLDTLRAEQLFALDIGPLPGVSVQGITPAGGFDASMAVTSSDSIGGGNRWLRRRLERLGGGERPLHSRVNFWV
jgi:hypothetical protein